MLTEYEAQQLMRGARRDLAVTPWIVVKSEVGLFVIAEVPLLGIQIALRHDTADHTAAAGRNATERAQPPSISKSRQLMEERRKRVESQTTVQAVHSLKAAAGHGAQIPEIDEFTPGTRRSD